MWKTRSRNFRGIIKPPWVLFSYVFKYENTNEQSHVNGCYQIKWGNTNGPQFRTVWLNDISALSWCESDMHLVEPVLEIVNLFFSGLAKCCMILSHDSGQQQWVEAPSQPWNIFLRNFQGIFFSDISSYVLFIFEASILGKSLNIFIYRSLCLLLFFIYSRTISVSSRVIFFLHYFLIIVCS